MRNSNSLQTILFLAWIFGVTCRALPILGPAASDAPQQFHRPFNAKGPPRMVVRVIVSSSSSSSTVPAAEGPNFNRAPPDGYLADSSSVFARRTDHDLPERPSIRRSFVFFTKPNPARLQWAPPTTTSAAPSTAEEALEPSISPTPAYFKPTTYRPAVRQLWAPPTTAAPPSADPTTSVTSETAQSKDIFSAFYRAFSPPEPPVFPRHTFGFQHQQSHDGGGQSRSFHVASSNQRPQEGARTGRQLQTSEDRPQTSTSTTSAHLVSGSKIVTAIVSTSSTSTSVVSAERSPLSPVFNVNYSRVRPSGVMIMSMLSSKLDTGKNETQHDQRRTSNAAAEEVEASEAGDFESQRHGGPRAEALIAVPETPETVSTSSSSSSVTEAGQPVIWQMPEQVWGEPEKVWGESEKVWSSEGLPMKDAAVTTPPPASTEEDDSPKGSFFVLGEDDDQENPSEQIPPEFSQRIGAPSMEAPEAPPSSNAPQQLPDMTPNVDHSFVDPSTITSVKVAESIQLALKRHLNFKVHTTPFPTKYPQVAAVNSNNNQVGSNSHSHKDRVTLEGPREIPIIDAHSLATSSEPPELPGNKKFGYFQDGHDVRKYRVEERTPDGFIVGEYGILNQHNGFLRGVRYTADGTINPRLIHEALMKFLSL